MLDLCDQMHNSSKWSQWDTMSRVTHEHRYSWRKRSQKSEAKSLYCGMEVTFPHWPALQTAYRQFRHLLLPFILCFNNPFHGIIWGVIFKIAFRHHHQSPALELKDDRKRIGKPPHWKPYFRTPVERRGLCGTPLCECLSDRVETDPHSPPRFHRGGHFSNTAWEAVVQYIMRQSRVTANPLLRTNRER